MKHEFKLGENKEIIKVALARTEEEDRLTNLFIAEMEGQGIKTLEDLWDSISDRERDALVDTITTAEFREVYYAETERPRPADLKREKREEYMRITATLSHFVTDNADGEMNMEIIFELADEIYNGWLKEFEELPRSERGYIQEYAERIAKEKGYTTKEQWHEKWEDGLYD